MRWQAKLFVLSTAVFLGAVAEASTGQYSLTPPSSPQQVVAMINGQVQPRFQREAGLFGMCRVTVPNLVNGHPAVDFADMLNYETSADRQVFATVGRAPYFIIIGVMHLRHKPGQFKGQLDYDGQAQPLNTAEKSNNDNGYSEEDIPSTQPIEACGTSPSRAYRTYKWAEQNMSAATMSYCLQVKRGTDIDTTYGKFFVAIRPIKALRQECRSCHLGSRVGSTLGAMIYMVGKLPAGTHPVVVVYTDKPDPDY